MKPTDVDEYEKQIKEVEQGIRKEIEDSLTPEEKKLRRRIAISSLGALFFINLLLLCAEAVLPTYIETNYGKSITQAQVSLILS
jgi:hypothetical protein